MAKDPFSQRWNRKKKQGLFDRLTKKQADPDLMDEEEQILSNTKPVDPIEADAEPGRNDPCPCGSGKKYKKCCEGLDEAERRKKAKANAKKK